MWSIIILPILVTYIIIGADFLILVAKVNFAMHVNV